MSRIQFSARRARQAVTAIALLLSAAAAAAQGAPEGAPPSPEEAAAMAAFERAARVGEQHQRLAATAGEWTFSGQFWFAPGGPPMESQGTATRTVLVGGRVIEERVQSVMMGAPFEGYGHTGYDNVTGRYWSTWFDNMSTSLMSSTGTCEADTCSFTGTNTDPMTGQPATVRMTSKHSADREVHEMWGPGPDGAEFKMMELVYTRKR